MRVYGLVLIGLTVAAPVTATNAQTTMAYGWVADTFGGNDRVYEIELETGIARLLGFAPGRDLDGGLVLPDGRVMAIDGFNREYWELWPEQTQRGTPLLAGVDAGMAYDETTDTVYAISSGTFQNFESSFLYRVNPETGQTTFIGGDSVHYADGLAIDAKGNAYGLDLVFRSRLYSVNLQNGRLTTIATVRTAGGQVLTDGGGLAFGPDGTLWFTQSRSGEIWRLDPQTGIATFESRIDAHQNGFRWNFLAVSPRPLIPGDVNCDGQVSVGDINIFVDAMIDPVLYEEEYFFCYRRSGDFTGDLVVTITDINGFVAALTGL